MLVLKSWRKNEEKAETDEKVKKWGMIARYETVVKG